MNEIISGLFIVIGFICMTISGVLLIIKVIKDPDVNRYNFLSHFLKYSLKKIFLFLALGFVSMIFGMMLI